MPKRITKPKPAPAPEPKVWRLPDTYTPGQLVAVAKLIRREPETRFEVGAEENYWNSRIWTGAEWMRWFYEKLTEKINSKMPRGPYRRTAYQDMDLVLYTVPGGF